MKRKPNPTRDRADQRAEALRPLFKELAHLSANAIAWEFNQRGVPTPTEGARWHSQTVLRAQKRLKGKAR